MDLRALLELVFDRRVDLVLPETLKPRLRGLIDKDVQNYVNVEAMIAEGGTSETLP